MVYSVVPAHNEATTIGRVIRGLLQYGFTQVVVVDDGSTDATAEEAKAAGAIVLCHLLNRGQGAALQTGNEYALAHGATVVVHFDADGQFNPADIKPALEAMQRAKADVVFGSRFMDSRSRLPWTKQHLILPIGRLVNWLFTGLWLTDGQNGFRIMSRRALEQVRIRQDGMAHNTELTRQIAHKKIAFIEVPVEVTYHEYGQGIAGGFRIVRDMLLHLFTK